MLPQHHVSNYTLQRLPLYVSFLRSLPEDARNISSTEIAKSLGLNPVQVRKDLAAVGSKGRPRVGYDIDWLTRHLTTYLSGGREYSAVLVGLGNLGRALTAHSGLADYGFAVKAVFDNNQTLVGSRFAGHQVQEMHKLVPVCRQLQATVGIITVPKEQAQPVCDLLVTGGVQIVWNFSPAHLTAPQGVTVQDEDIAASLALITRQILGRRQADSGSTTIQGGESA